MREREREFLCVGTTDISVVETDLKKNHDITAHLWPSQH